MAAARSDDCGSHGAARPVIARPPARRLKSASRLSASSGVRAFRSISAELLDHRIRRRRLGEQGELPRISGGAGGGPGHHPVLALERPQHLARPPHHAVGQSGELGHVNAVGAVGAARLEPVQEHDRVAGLPHRHVEVPGVLQPLGQLHQLVVVGGEHRLAADPVVQVLGDRPGDRHPVVGRGAAADLVEQHQAPAVGVVQDGAGLAHLHHEGRLAPREVVARAHPGEEPVHHADRRRPRPERTLPSGPAPRRGRSGAEWWTCPPCWARSPAPPARPR